MECRSDRVFPDIEAVRGVVGAGRMYLYTLGSNQGNAHVHRHVVPLAPGVSYEEEQQGAWAGWDDGVLKITERGMFRLAGQIGRRL